MSYVVIRSCAEPVDMAAFCRWYRKGFGGTQDEASAVIERLRKGRRHTFFVGDREAKALLRKFAAWGLTGVTLHDDDDMSEHPSPPGILARWWYRWRGWR